LSSDFPVVSNRRRHVSASVSGYLRSRARSRKREKRKPAKKVSVTRKHYEIWGLAQLPIQEALHWRKIVAQPQAMDPPYPQTQPVAWVCGRRFGSKRAAKSVSAATA
jgi:hypothetical protein